jgi:hypothetical protein
VIDKSRFINLGVIKKSTRRNFNEIDEIFAKLHQIFSSNDKTKANIVDILQTFIPDFKHIEKGKGLDSRM